MCRFLGFVIGSALSLGAMLLLLGLPETHTARPAVGSSGLDALVEGLEDVKSDPETIAEPLIGDVAETPERTEAAAAEPVAETPPLTAIGPIDVELEGLAEPLDRVTDTAERYEDSAQVASSWPSVGEVHWHAFWNPFRSEIAANGFVTQLERVTGLQYRVVKIRTGSYQVAFAYRNDTERRTKLSQIEAATGLDLPEI